MIKTTFCRDCGAQIEVDYSFLDEIKEEMKSRYPTKEVKFADDLSFDIVCDDCIEAS